MSDVPNLAGRLEDLAAREGATGPYVLRSMLATDTWTRRRLSRRKLKILHEIDPTLRPMLDEGERVVFLTWGSFSSVWEMALGGWATQLINQRAVVVTDRRMLLLQISTHGKPRFVRAQIAYGAVHEVTTTLFGNLWIHFRDGSRQMVAGMPRADRKALTAVVSRLAEDAAPAGSAVQDLCPHCADPVDEELRLCPHCGGAFKAPLHATALSFLFPGMGDVYLGHRGFAALEIVVAAFFWLGILTLAFDPSVPPAAFAVMVGVVVLFLHGMDALATRHIARGGLYPARATERPWLRYAVAVAGPAIVLGLATGPVSSRRGLAPVPTLVAGADLPARHVEALRAAGYLEPDEEIIHFYSAGIATILEDGNILTDRRLVSYAQEFDRAYFEALPYDSIVDLSLGPWRDAPALSSLRVAGEDGHWFMLVVPAAEGQDTTFLRAVEDRWRASRARATGVWYDGGAGFDPDDAVVIRGLRYPEQAEAAERRWLDLWIGERDGPWEVRSRVRHRLGTREVDELVVLTSAGDQVVYFDVTGGR